MKAKLEVLAAVKHFHRPFTNAELCAYLKRTTGNYMDPTVTWVGLMRLAEEGVVNYNRKTHRFNRTGQKARRNIVQINSDGSIARRIA